MRRLSAILVLGLTTAALAAADVAPAPPGEQTAVYYNARMALRGGDPNEALKLWLLRNALEDHTGQVSQHDPDFHSVTWAAMGQLGVCPDGHPRDGRVRQAAPTEPSTGQAPGDDAERPPHKDPKNGAGLWPVAVHNHMIRTMGARPQTGGQRPFDAFEVGRQQRFVAIGDVLSAQELQSVRFFRGKCARPRLAATAAGELPNADLSDRQVVARTLRHLLLKAQLTLSDERVRGQSVIKARMFDINLKLTELAAKEAKKLARDQAVRARQLRLSPEAIAAMRRAAPEYTLQLESESASILRESVQWPVSEWMALSSDRRLFLFDNARSFGEQPAQLDATALGILDALLEQGDGGQVEKWIPRVSPQAAPMVWGGERGQRLMDLDLEAGFRERGVIALHRGVHHLERGELPEALRLMAFAMQHAPESRAGDVVQALSLRWLSYVSSQFEITDGLLTTLKALVPRREYAVLLEDLMWRAAFRADPQSFERGTNSLTGRGALKRRVEWLTPLASGDVGSFSRKVRAGLKESPSETLRFLDQLIQRLELEDGPVRESQLGTLKNVRGLLLSMPMEAGGRQSNKVEALLARSQGIIEGLEGLQSDASDADKARSLAPTGEVYAGAVRLAPVDPLPWPFKVGAVSAPSIFTPMNLTPVEWRDAQGEWVFGWSMSD